MSAWGRIVVHDDGFRAEHARVEALAVRRRCAAYGAAARRSDAAAAARASRWSAHGELEAFAAGLGGGVPAALRP